MQSRLIPVPAARLIVAMLVCLPSVAAAQLSIVQTTSGPVRGTSAGASGQAKVPLLIGHNADEAFFY